MKKLKLVGLFAMLLVAAMVLSSCATLSNLDKIFNDKYDMSEKLFKNVAEIEDLEGYSVYDTNYEFAVFTKAWEDDTKIKIYSFRSGSVIHTLTTSEDTDYNVEFITMYGSALPVYCVVKTVEGTGLNGEDRVTRTYYDATGAEVVSVLAENEVGEPKALSDNFVIINAVAYTVDANAGTLTKKADVPAYVSYENIDEFNDEYFYSFIDERSLVIYDIDFTPVAIWNAPSYVDNIELFVLNNGNVLIQYSVELDAEETKFDYYDEDGKYDLVSLLLTTKGKLKDVDLDCVVAEVIPNYEIYDDTLEKNENMFTDKFENIAVIYRIENQKIDDSMVNAEYVLMNNSAKVKESLKMIDGQIFIPQRVGDDLYLAQTVYGMALINGKGKVQFNITSDISVYGGYIITDTAIYDMEFTLVYDLAENNARVVREICDTIFVEVGEDGDEIISFRNGTKTEVFSDSLMKDMEFVSDVGYVIINTANAKPYTYYAADGTELIKVESELEFVADNGDDVMILSAIVDGNMTYYAFTK